MREIIPLSIHITLQRDVQIAFSRGRYSGVSVRFALIYNNLMSFIHVKCAPALSLSFIQYLYSEKKNVEATV